MNSTHFQALSPSAVATIVREEGPRTCVFPINGTRRWFLLEHPPESPDYWDAYMELGSRNHVEMYGLFFEHGIPTLLNPIFGLDILQRGDEYMAMSAPGMAMMCTHPIFTEFYEKYDVRVRFYGEYRRYLGGTPYEWLADTFDQVYEDTKHHKSHRLYYGVCAHDPAEWVAQYAVQYHQQHGGVPDRAAIIEAYYGETVNPVDLFIGFDKFAAYDMPLLTTGNEDLYFMVSPSPYLNGEQLRAILYDHLYGRRDDNDIDYGTFTSEDWNELRAFYNANRGATMGVGTRHPKLGYWYPLPQIDLTFNHVPE